MSLSTCLQVQRSVLRNIQQRKFVQSSSNWTPILQKRNVSLYAVDEQVLTPCSERTGYRPMLKYNPHKVWKRNIQLPDNSALKRALEGSDNWTSECQPRLNSTGVYNPVNISIWTEPDGTPIRPDNPHGSSTRILRKGCCIAAYHSTPLEQELAARRLCAETEDPRYPVIYRSIEDQAHTLYLLGRVELEGEPKLRRVAWYMLSLAAGLGQLDAALLLHQLHKQDLQLSPEVEVRTVIEEAAVAKFDWRAIVAHCEHITAKHRQRRGAARGHHPDMEHCLSLLNEAMTMTSPNVGPQTTREPPIRGYLDAETLETYDPPYKLILDLVSEEVLANTGTELMYQSFEQAARVGALQYYDPQAAWLYAKWEALQGREYSTDWVSAMEMAAQDGNADACFQLARYYLKRDGWFPSVASKVLQDADRRDNEKMKHSQKAADFTTVSDEEKHVEIMVRKDDGLLQRWEGISWMRASAELQLESPTKMVNRFYIIGGLLRQNGFDVHGRNTLLEAYRMLENSNGDATKKSQALRGIQEYLQNWDKRRVHELLTPDQIALLLEASSR